MVKPAFLSVKILFFNQFKQYLTAPGKNARKGIYLTKSLFAAFDKIPNLYSLFILIQRMFCYFKTFFSRIAETFFLNQL